MRLLLATPVFPPALSSPSIVVGKAVKYLLREGWQVTVLTGRKSGLDDPALLEDVGKLEALDEFPLTGYSNFSSLLRPLMKNLYGLTPYRESGLWYSSAKSALQKILARNSYDVILGVNASTPALIRLVAEASAPHSLKAVWYIDPWYLSSLVGFRDTVKGFFWRPLEKSLLRCFHLIILNSESLLRAYQRAIPEKAEHCFHYLQGFDPEDYAPFAGREVPPSSEFHIGYFGTVRPEEIRALHSLMRSLYLLPPAVRSRITLYIRGWITPRRRRQLLQAYAYLHPHSTEGQSFFRLRLLTEPLSYLKTLCEMSKMDAFLVSRDLRYKPLYSGKIFQYLAFRKPILFIGPEGSAEGELLERVGCGKAFPVENPPLHSLTDYLMTLYNQRVERVSSVNIQQSLYENLKTPVQISRLSQKLLSLMSERR